MKKPKDPTGTKAKRKAISYIRFSTMAQGDDGRDSTTRQKNALTDALKKWNLELDGTFTDKKSGFKMKHIAKGGAMHTLRKLAIDGKLRGKVLVVEDFDRAGRMQVTDAAPLLLDIINNGVEMVVGAYGGEYFSKEIVNANPYLFYRALDEMNRGFGESSRKSDMARAKWKTRLDAVASGKPVGLNSIPFWLVNEKDSKGFCTGKFLMREGMKKLIREVFSLYLSGEGSQVIANKFNKRGVPIPQRRNGAARKNANVWHSTCIQKIIKNRALLGYYHGTESKIFPVLISETDFYRANQKRKERIRFSGSKAAHVNPYSGLCLCANCGGHLSRHSSRKNQQTVDKYVYLQCRSSRRGVCSAAGIPYARFEESFSNFLSHIEHLGKPKLETAEPSKCDEIRNNLAHVEKKISSIKAAFAKMEDPSKAVSLGTMLTDYDIQHAQLVKDLEEETIREKGTPKLTKGHFDYLKSLFGKENKLQDPETRLEIQEALRESIDRITIDVKTQSYEVTWKNSSNVFKVQLKKDGYRISGEGCINLEATDF
jgi:hypothetical protein